MPRSSRKPKDEAFNFRVDPELKEAFAAAAGAEDKPAAQVLRDFMRAFVAAQQSRSLAAEARRQSMLVAAAAKNPHSDEAQVLRELEGGLDDTLRGERGA